MISEPKIMDIFQIELFIRLGFLPNIKLFIGTICMNNINRFWFSFKLQLYSLVNEPDIWDDPGSDFQTEIIVY